MFNSFTQSGFSEIPKGRDIPSMQTNDLQRARPQQNTYLRNIWSDEFVNEQIKNDPIHKARIAGYGYKLRNPFFNDFIYKKSTMPQKYNYVPPQSMKNNEFPEKMVSSTYGQANDSLDNFVQKQLQKSNSQNISPYYKKSLNKNFIHVGSSQPTYNGPFSNINSPENDCFKQILRLPDTMKLKQNVQAQQLQLQLSQQVQQQTQQQTSQIQKPQQSQQFLQKQQQAQGTINQNSADRIQSQPDLIQKIVPRNNKATANEYLDQSTVSQNVSTLNRNQNQQASNEIKIQQQKEFNLPSINQPQNSNQMSSSRMKVYQPYNIIINKRYLDYKPKFELPNVKWDWYDRQKFQDYRYKDMSHPQIKKILDTNQTNYLENSTSNMTYGNII